MAPEDSDRALFSHIAQEFGEFGTAAVQFLITAADLVDSGDAALQPRLGEAVAYCVREALKRILDSVERPGAARLQAASRRVTAAKKKLDQIRGLPGADEEAAVAELLRAVDELDDFHNEQGIHERRIIAVLVSRTGVVAFEGSSSLIVEYQRLIEELNAAVHGECGLEVARTGLDQALRLLRQLFLPPDVRFPQLDALAAIAAPTSDDVEALHSFIAAPSHLEYLLTRAVSVRWLDLLTDSGLVTPPAGQGAWPVYKLIENLAATNADEIIRWLNDAYDRWGDDPIRARYLVRAAADLGDPGHGLLLRALRAHQQDTSICHTVDWALEDVDARAPIVAQVADYLLNDQGGLQRISLLQRDAGVLAKLVDGITIDNAEERLRLLSFKIRAVSADDSARQLTLHERAGSIADRIEMYQDDRFAVLLTALLAAIGNARAAGWTIDQVFTSVDVQDTDLAGRVRSWILATTPSVDLEVGTEELTTAIATRRPCGDDIPLIDRIVAQLPTQQYADRWRTALGEPPSSEQVASALADHDVAQSWFRARDWSALLPEACTAGWKTAVTLLAGAYGAVTRDSFERLRVPEFGMGQSPMTVEAILDLQPGDAAAAIRTWRPDPSQWLVSARELARALEEAIKREPQPWLREPIEMVGNLREPIYLSHYFRAVSQLDIDLAAQAGPLVEAVAFCARHPWEAAVLGRDDWDYDANWDSVDQAGVALLQKLANDDRGFGVRTEQAWQLVSDAARNRSAGSAVAPHDDSPLLTAINRPCTKALETAIAILAYEFRSAGTVRADGLALLDEALRLPSNDGAEHRAIIAPRLGFLLHIAHSWVEERTELLVGTDAPDGLAQTTVDLALRWGQPNRWIFEHARLAVIDAAGRRVENALTALLIAMLWKVDDYQPTQLVDRLGQIDGALLSEAGESLGRLLRADDTEPEHLHVGTEFWRTVLKRGHAEEMPGFGWWSEVRTLDRNTWETLTLKSAKSANGKLDWSHAVAERAAGLAISERGLAILNELVRGQVDDWDRMSIMDTSVDALRTAKTALESTEDFQRLRTTLIERGRFDAKEI